MSATPAKRLDFFERYLSLWVLACMLVGVAAGQFMPGVTVTLSRWEFGYLTEGDSAYTLAQVAINDLIMLVAFAPIVMFLVGVSGVVVPKGVLITSVVVFIVIPLVAGCSGEPNIFS